MSEDDEKLVQAVLIGTAGVVAIISVVVLIRIIILFIEEYWLYLLMAVVASIGAKIWFGVEEEAEKTKSHEHQRHQLVSIQNNRHYSLNNNVGRIFEKGRDVNTVIATFSFIDPNNTIRIEPDIIIAEASGTLIIDQAFYEHGGLFSKISNNGIDNEGICIRIGNANQQIVSIKFLAGAAVFYFFISHGDTVIEGRPLFAYSRNDRLIKYNQREYVSGRYGDPYAESNAQHSSMHTTSMDDIIDAINDD